MIVIKTNNISETLNRDKEINKDINILKNYKKYLSTKNSFKS